MGLYVLVQRDLVVGSEVVSRRLVRFGVIGALTMVRVESVQRRKKEVGGQLVGMRGLGGRNRGGSRGIRFLQAFARREHCGALRMWIDVDASGFGHLFCICRLQIDHLALDRDCPSQLSRGPDLSFRCSQLFLRAALLEL
jgi:hypothetical protein